MTSCLLIECCSYHWEVFPNWVSHLNNLGVSVDITCPASPGHLETLDMLGLPRLPIERFSEIPFERYDFLLFGTLRHEGYAHDATSSPLPGLELIQRIGQPSIGVIHEPVLWSEQRPVLSFDAAYSGGNGIVNLFPDQRFNWSGRWSERAEWAWEGEALILFENGNRMELASPDGGESFLGPGSVVLRRRPQPRVDLLSHTANARNAILTFSAEGSRILSERCPNVEWILPFGGLEPGAREAVEDFVIAGSVDYERKAIPSLLQACRFLRADEKVVVLGGTRDPTAKKNPSAEKLMAALASMGLEDKVTFTGYLPYDRFIDHVCTSRFLLPLVDDHTGNGGSKSQMTGTFSLSLGLGIPMIINRSIAELYGFDFMICYDDEDLASGIARARSLGACAYSTLCQQVESVARRQQEHNLQTLNKVIEGILS